MPDKPLSLWPEDLEPKAAEDPKSSGRVWRSGFLLVIDRHAALPPICLKSGLPATHWVKRELNWYPAGADLFLVLGIVPYLVMTMLISSVALIEIGLCEDWYQRQRLRLLFGKSLGGTGLVTVIGAILFGALTKEHEIALVLIVLGACIGLAGLALAFWGSRLVTAHKIDTDYIWLAGVHPIVLSQLPEWPGK